MKKYKIIQILLVLYILHLNKFILNCTIIIIIIIILKYLLQLVDLESPVLVVTRRNIASGKLPVAARESAVRYQMACKEDDYTYSKTFRFVSYIYDQIEYLLILIATRVFQCIYRYMECQWPTTKWCCIARVVEL